MLYWLGEINFLLLLLLLRKTCSDGDARSDSGKLFQTDAAAAGKVRSPMVARTVKGMNVPNGLKVGLNLSVTDCL